MPTLLIGDDTVYPGSDGGVSTGRQDALQFTAVGTGTVDTLALHIAATGGFSTIELGIYSDNADAPDTLLGSGTWTGDSSFEQWVVVTGLSIAVTSGTKYWLAAVPIDGGLDFGIANFGGGGTPEWASSFAPFTELQATWPASGPSFQHDHGPAGFQALSGGFDETPVETSGGLEWHITGLWYPDAESVDYYGMIADPLDGEVVIPLNDSRTAGVTVSLHDAIVGDVIGHTYARCLKVYYRDHLVFWGPVKLTEVDLTGDDERGPTVRLSAVDPSLRMVRHYVRRGDELTSGTLSADNDDKGTLSVDHIGLRLLRDCANNIPEQTTRGVPDLGVIDGSNDFVAAPDNLMGVVRGDEVFNAMRELSQSLGPDFELQPTENTTGAYARLNTYIQQGTDKTATVKWHYATGRDNLEGLSFTEGSQYVTHAHVLDRTNAYRFTELNLASSAETGQYTYWDATDYDSTGVPAADVETVLRAYGKEIIAAYGNPLVVVALSLPVEIDAAGELHYVDDYVVGDIVEVAGRTGRVQLAAGSHRITEVRLAQSGPENSVAPQITVVPSVALTVDDTDTEG